jgi:hypothetical protein
MMALTPGREGDPVLIDEKLPVVNPNHEGVTHDLAGSHYQLKFSVMGGRVEIVPTNVTNQTERTFANLTFDAQRLALAIKLSRFDKNGNLLLDYPHLDTQSKPIKISVLKLPALEASRLLREIKNSPSSREWFDSLNLPKFPFNHKSTSTAVMFYDKETKGFGKGKKYHEVMDGTQAIGMDKKDFIDLVAAHELSHFAWDQLSPNDKKEIIDLIDVKNINFRIFLGFFDKDLPYGETAYLRAKQNTNDSFYREDTTTESKAGKYLDKETVMDEFIAFASWSSLGFPREKLSGIVREGDEHGGFSQTASRLCKHASDCINENPLLKAKLQEKIYPVMLKQFPFLRLQIEEE